MIKNIIRMILIALLIAVVFVSTINATEPNTNTNADTNTNTVNTLAKSYVVAWSYNTIKNGKITIKDGEGIKKVVDSDAGGRYEIVEGTKVTIYCIPDYGYHFVGNYLAEDNNSAQFVAGEEENEYSFEMPSQNIILSNNFEKLTNADLVNGKVEKINSLTFSEFGNKNIKSGQVVVDYTEGEPIADVKTKLDNLAEENDLLIIDYLEINVKNRITKGYSGVQNDVYWTSEVTELENPVTISAELPELYRGKSKYKAIVYHNSDAKLLDAKYNALNGKISFETDRFSYYALAINKPVLVAAATPSNTTSNTVSNTVTNTVRNTAGSSTTTNAVTTTAAVTTGNNNPATGDEIDGYITAFAISTVIMVAIVLSYKMDRYE